MKKQLFLSLLALTVAAGARADEARLLRFPATNGTDVVFTYAGDLYTAPLSGGEARRLTSHVGYEIFPRFSPDGRTIAFTAEYDGNREVYVIPAGGGEPRRLTYTATNERDDVGDRMGPNNIVMAWTPNGEGVVYRNRIGSGFQGRLWVAPLKGGMPRPLPLPEGGFCAFSPDNGSRLAYNRVFREFRNWKYYRGGMADDIWLYDPQAKSVQNLTDNTAQDICPMWIGEEIYFLSDRDKTMNLFAYNTRTRQTEKVTDYADYDIKFPSTDGRQIVYEHAGYLYRFDPQTRKSEQIYITLGAENVYARPGQMHVSAHVTSAGLSADGRRLAVTARGEVFDVPVKSGVTRNITRTPGANERGADWSPDGRYIAYISDRTGETEIFLQPAAGGDPVQLTTGNDTYIRSLAWSPDSKTLLYTDRKNRVVAVDVAKRAKTILLQNPEQEFRDVQFSPDSRWITYTKPAANNFSVVYVYDLLSKKEYPVTEKWYNSSSPTFSTDGRYLVFESDRDFNPVYGRLEWNHVYTRLGGIYLALLAGGTPSPFLPEDGPVAEAQAEEAAPGPKDGKKKDGKKADSPAVAIDPEGIAGRIVKLPLPAADYWNLYSDGQTVWYYGNGGTHAFDLREQKDELVAEGALMAPVSGSRKALFMKGRTPYVGELSAHRVSLDTPVDLGDMVAPVDYGQEWAQIFDEAWRAYRDGFYVESMHGVDWQAVKEKYAVLLPYVKTRLDLNYLIGEMIAELACGHAYVNPGEYPRPKRVPMGLLGAELSRDEQTGFFRIDRILPGAPYSEKLRSPLAEPGMGIKEGDYITSIDGVSTASVKNVYQLLVGKAGVLTELGVNTRPSADGAKKVVVEPTDDEYPLYHYNWVQKNLRRVEEATGGRVGYIYIPDMGPEGLNEFARYFYPQLDKEALIIDDRANGGGNVSPMIIERLLRQPYRLTMSRVSTKTGTIPDATQVGPKVLLVNKYSASDGDLFPWSFKANKLGTVVGTRTWGGIVGISGSLPYMDGTDIRVPFFTNYDARTGQWIVENHGVDPDILIDNDPIQEQAGVDQQLEKAIEVALQQLKDRKPLPGVPAPRTMKDLGVE